MENIRIFVSTYNFKCHQLKDYMIPIEVGSTGRNNFMYPCHDNVGENISHLNPYFGELTGIYWIIKNVNMNDDDIIGFFHYNKHFAISERRIRSILKEKEFIVAKPEKIRPHARADEYSTFVEVMKELNPEFFKAYEAVVDNKGSGYVSGGNMVITRKALFDEYYTIIFPILLETYERIGEADTGNYYKRYCAFFSERMLTAFLRYKGYKSEPYKIHFVGSINWYIAQLFIRGINKVFPDLKLSEKYGRYLRRSGYTK